MSSFEMNLIYLIVIILVPIIPAFILFKFVESFAEGKTPVQGFLFKFGGAFAGYLFVFLMLFWKLPNKFSFVTETDEVWEIKGKIVDANGEGLDGSNRAYLELIPMPVNLLPNGDFKMKLVATKSNNQPVPDYCISVKDAANIYLPSNVTRTLTSYITDSCNKSICIGNIQMSVNPKAISAPVDALQISKY